MIRGGRSLHTDEGNRRSEPGDRIRDNAAFANAQTRRASLHDGSADRCRSRNGTQGFFVLSHMLTLAVDWELIPSNVAKSVELPKPPAGRIRYLQPTELHAVLAACPESLRPIAGLLAFTGMRRSEVLGLRWLDIDRKGERILLPQTKNGPDSVAECACL